MSTSTPPPGFPEPEPVRFELPPPPRTLSPRLKAVLAMAAVVVVIIIAFVAFGGSSATGVDPVAQAATVSSTAPGYQMRMSMVMSASSIPTPITATATGTFDTRSHSGSISMSMNLGNYPQVTQRLGSSAFDMREILAGTTVYMKLPAVASGSLPLGGKQWFSFDIAKVKGLSGISSLMSSPTSSNPAQFLQYLRAESDSIVTEGHDVVDGVMATHYHADLNFDRVANALPASDRAAVQQAISTIERVTHLHRVPADVWVDGQHLVRRIRMTIAVPATAGLSLNEDVTVDFVHYGPEPATAPPPASQVADLTGVLGAGG